MLGILVLDDHEVIRHGVRSLLESNPGWSVVAEASNGREAVELAEKLHPDIAVLDINVPELSGLEVARLIRKKARQTEIIILTVDESEQMLWEALQSGARGYVLKSDAGNDLIRAIEAARRRKQFVSPRLAGAAEAMKSPQASGSPLDTLTARERQVLKLLAEGKSTKEVATVLDIAVKTAETHRVNTMRKLGLHSVSEVALFAIRHKVVEA